jgi:ribosome-associated toxin RatA of RatAB toxin-antitoxin module
MSPLAALVAAETAYPGLPGVRLTAVSLDLSASEAYAAICDFERYPELTDAVRSVEVSRRGDEFRSAWEVNFRNGILRWVKRDTFDDRRLITTFEQLEGDFALFAGRWHAQPADTGCRVTFEAAFDLGIPSLSAILNPVAQRTLALTIDVIVRGLVPGRLAVQHELFGGATPGSANGSAHFR